MRLVDKDWGREGRIYQAEEQRSFPANSALMITVQNRVDSICATLLTRFTPLLERSTLSRQPHSKPHV